MSNTTPFPENSGYENAGSQNQGFENRMPRPTGDPQYTGGPTAWGPPNGAPATPSPNLAQDPSQQAPTKKKRGKLAYLLSGCGCFVLLLIVIAGCSALTAGGGDDGGEKAPAAVSATTEKDSSDAKKSATEDESDPEADARPAEDVGANGEPAKDEVSERASADKEPAGSSGDEEQKGDAAKEGTDSAGTDVPTEYTSALNKAETYSDLMYMSKKGIYDQLTSEYGEGFTPEAAQYAVDNLEADWNTNALEKAKTYQSEMDMSPAAIRDQLTSEYGEQFTQEQADYAIEHLDD